MKDRLYLDRGQICCDKMKLISPVARPSAVARCKTVSSLTGQSGSWTWMLFKPPSSFSSWLQTGTSVCIPMMLCFPDNHHSFYEGLSAQIISIFYSTDVFTLEHYTLFMFFFLLWLHCIWYCACSVLWFIAGLTGNKGHFVSDPGCFGGRCLFGVPPRSI